MKLNHNKFDTKLSLKRHENQEDILRNTGEVQILKYGSVHMFRKYL